MPNPAILLAAAFLAGSIPFGLIVGRVFFDTDIRASGSGNIGAANALRTYGRRRARNP
jgi:glycerol-3-phosphate acyltransferase PlsY